MELANGECLNHWHAAIWVRCAIEDFNQPVSVLLSNHREPRFALVWIAYDLWRKGKQLFEPMRWVHPLTLFMQLPAMLRSHSSCTEEEEEGG